MNYALITGATSGIGYELAKIFGKNGFGLLLVSSNQKRLETTKNSLKELCHEPIYIFEQDLTRLGAAKELYEKIKEMGITVSVLVNNAGFGTIGAASGIPLAQDENMMILNVVNLVELCKLYIPQMEAHGGGKILNVSSTGAFQPGPYTASYYASKSFVLSYTRAIRREVREKNIQVCALCPGTTNTGFFEKAGTKIPGGAMPPEKVAAAGYRGLMHNREIIIPGLHNRLMQIFPVRWKMWVIGKIKGRHC